LTKRGISLGVLSPHPPIVVPEIGEENLPRVKKTRDALQQMASLVRHVGPDTVVIVAPHGPVVRDAVTLMASPILEGNFREFGVEGTLLRYGNDTRLVNLIQQRAAESNLRVVAADANQIAAHGVSSTLHYAILVPLYYLKQAGVECRLVAGTMGLLDRPACYRFGQVVRDASAELGVRVVYVASGDLSHRLIEGAPAGYDPVGRVFDRKVVEALTRADVKPLLELDPELVEKAGECGLGPIISLLGALDGLDVVPDVLSYEGPFGVGYAVATYIPRNAAGGRSGEGAAERPGGQSTDAEGESETRQDLRRETECGPGKDDGPNDQQGVYATGDARSGSHPFVRLARLALETYVREGREIAPPPSCPGLDRRAGAFVSLKTHGELRGCIGTIEPTAANLAEEIIRNAIQAGTADPRFPPVTEDELGHLSYSVDVLEPAEPVAGLEDLDPENYGVIVAKGGRTGLLLPALEGIETAGQQVEIARRKAGIGPHETGVRLFRFKVTRYH